MKKQILMCLALLSAFTYAQKDEFKEIKKAFKSKDYKSAKVAVDKYSDVFEKAQDKYKLKYLGIKALTLYNLVVEGDNSLATDAVIAFKEAPKSTEIDLAKSKLVQTIQARAQKAYQDKNIKEAAIGYRNLYRLNPKDTVFLYSAASIALMDKKYYDMSVEIYKELIDIGYDGSGIVYTATNTQTGKEEAFSKNIRDMNVKLGTHKDPKDTKEPSKKPEIVKNLALIYVQQGKKDKALKAFAAARAANPDDVNLIVSEANIYYEMGDKDKFKELLKLAIEKKPDDPDLYYNIGVANGNLENYEEAITAYKKALSLKPDYKNAVINLSGAYINKGNDMIDVLNKLSKENKWKEFDKVKLEKDEYYKKAAAVIEQYLDKNPKTNDLFEQLKQIYGALGDNENFNRIKKLLEE